MPLAKLLKTTIYSMLAVFLAYSLSDILLAFFMSIVLAYILYPIAFSFQFFLKRIPIKQETSWDISCSLTICIFLFISIVIPLFFIPVIIDQVHSIIIMLKKIDLKEIWLSPKLLPLHERISELIQLSKPHVDLIVENGINRVIHLSQSVVNKTTPIMLSFISSVHNLFYGFLIFMMSFHMIRDTNKWKSRIEDLFRNTSLGKYSDAIRPAIENFSSGMRQLVIGQMLLCNVMSIYYISIFLICGFSPLLGIIFGYGPIIPYMGDIVATALLIFDFISRGLVIKKLIIAGLAIFIGHNISSHLLSPILIGNYVGVSPIQILLGFMLHTHFLGFLGLLLNIPLCILEKSIFIALFPKVGQQKIHES